MEELSDESVIESTPVKKKSRIFKHRTKFRSPTTKNNKNEDEGKLTSGKSDLLEKLVAEFEKNITQAAVVKTVKKTLASETESPDVQKPLVQSCSQETSTLEVGKNHEDIINESTNSLLKENEIHYCGITKPMQKPFSKNSHKLYVFYLIEEVLKFCPNYFPKNSHIQLVGIISHCKKNNEFILYSIERTYDEHFKIKVDPREVIVKPTVDDKIVLFGLLSFDEQIPMIVVKFFQPLTVVSSVYRELMLKLRTTVPLENFEMVSVNSEDRVTDDSVIEEMDNMQELCDILTQKMDLEGSQQPFTSNCLGDSTLHAFLDEISFEQL